MTSKEALKRCNYVAGLDIASLCKEEFDVIQKDLDRLEILEQENQKLKEKIKPYELWNEIKQDMVKSFEGICLHDFNIQYIRNSEKYFGSEMAVVRGTTLQSLISENQELKEYFSKIASGNTIIELFRENEELKEKIRLTHTEFGFNNLSDFRKQMRANVSTLTKIEKEIKFLADNKMQIFKFPNGRTILGFDISDLEKEKYQKMVDEVLKKLLKEVLCDVT